MLTSSLAPWCLRARQGFAFRLSPIQFLEKKERPAAFPRARNRGGPGPARMRQEESAFSRMRESEELKPPPTLRSSDIYSLWDTSWVRNTTDERRRNFASAKGDMIRPYVPRWLTPGARSMKRTRERKRLGEEGRALGMFHTRSRQGQGRICHASVISPGSRSRFCTLEEAMQD